LSPPVCEQKAAIRYALYPLRRRPSPRDAVVAICGSAAKGRHRPGRWLGEIKDRENPMTLKICHLISGDHWAGAEVMAFQLLSGLNTLPGIDLFVILLNKGRLSDELSKCGYTHVRS